jgi:peroxiredoxin
MVRYWAVALLALLPTAAPAQTAAGKRDKETRIEGMLSQADAKDTKRGTPCKVHLVKMRRGVTYTIDMKSRQFDSYLRLEDKNGRQLDEDDDGGGNLDARIIFNCPKDGEYRVICTCFQAASGKYTLLVKTTTQEQRTASGHGALIGKAAPDFRADFAVNGKPGKLSDLKGKVVLLEFWEVRSGPCTATFPRMSQWHKAHKAAGLEVVGVTYYHHELGHRLGFDKEAGKVKNLPKADRASEQAMLRDFAAYHKLDYPLLVLPKQDALAAFDAYLVNGIPQLVLIDRRGIIRAIQVGEGEQTVAAVEAELKKVLAEK